MMHSKDFQKEGNYLTSNDPCLYTVIVLNRKSLSFIAIGLSIVTGCLRANPTLNEAKNGIYLNFPLDIVARVSPLADKSNKDFQSTFRRLCDDNLPQAQEVFKKLCQDYTSLAESMNIENLAFCFYHFHAKNIPIPLSSDLHYDSIVEGLYSHGYIYCGITNKTVVTYVGELYVLNQ
ncbi:MAG: hypothetical protein LBF43_01520 [Puniceicoccales bacterium]|jgi:hypothetical protein|nr:hypothetical protein [Puniceicoccales bacterium]